MASMCEECKCSVVIGAGCDNGCPCCNDPDYVSDSDKLVKLIEYIKITAIGLRQDLEGLSEEMEKLDENSKDFRDLDLEYNLISGQEMGLRHIMQYVQDELDFGVGI